MILFFLAGRGRRLADPDSLKLKSGSGQNIRNIGFFSSLEQAGHPQAPLPALGLQALLRAHRGEN